MTNLPHRQLTRIRETGVDRDIAVDRILSDLLLHLEPGTRAEREVRKALTRLNVLNPTPTPRHHGLGD